jgi:25S rRNA (adenine2142-N1)-methyltransferase
VGAVRHDNYRDCVSWLDVTAIDLHSRHPSILEQDFLLMDLSEHREAWDVVSLSLVLNFVPDGKDRGTIHSPFSKAFFLLLGARCRFVVTKKNNTHD